MNRDHLIARIADTQRQLASSATPRCLDIREVLGLCAEQIGEDELKIEDQFLADAILIASAPKLYEACKKALPVCEALEGEGFIDNSTWDAMVAKLRAALAAAIPQEGTP